MTPRELRLLQFKIALLLALGATVGLATVVYADSVDDYNRMFAGWRIIETSWQAFLHYAGQYAMWVASNFKA